MKKEIYSKKFDGKEITKVDIVEDESVSIRFADETSLVIVAHHRQDCCEHVYGDFSAATAQFKELAGEVLKEVVIKSVSEMGVLLNFVTGYRENNKIFVPCYNSQNGYYSSELSLRINDGETITEIDISDSVEDNID